MQIKWTEDKNYGDAVKFSLVYQLILLLFSGFILDGGQCTQYMLVVMAAFWVSVIVLILRNPKNPKLIDIIYIKFGFFPILFAVPFIMNLVWTLRGII